MSAMFFDACSIVHRPPPAIQHRRTRQEATVTSVAPEKAWSASRWHRGDPPRPRTLHCDGSHGWGECSGCWTRCRSSNKSLTPKSNQKVNLAMSRCEKLSSFLLVAKEYLSYGCPGAACSWKALQNVLLMLFVYCLLVLLFLSHWFDTLIELSVPLHVCTSRARSVPISTQWNGWQRTPSKHLSNVRELSITSSTASPSKLLGFAEPVRKHLACWQAVFYKNDARVFCLEFSTKCRILYGGLPSGRFLYPNFDLSEAQDEAC